MIKKLVLKSSFILALLTLVSCSQNQGNVITYINIGTHSNNELKIQIDVTTKDDVQVYAEYWSDKKGIKSKIKSPISKNGLKHSLVLCSITPETNYTFQLITVQGKNTNTSKLYTFKSRKLPEWLQKQFKANCPKPELLSKNFKSGFMLMGKRETPGVAYIVDYKGNLRWYHTVEGTGFKVTHFTKDQTILSILGKNDEPTSYGSEILEINLQGDTLMHIKKGQGDLKQSIHHEIIKKSANEIVTITVDKKIMDLTSIGGKKNDTINSDGILILDKKGKKIWKWSVFDDLDPLKDKNILKNKKDWTHANSLNYDKDGNFLISFYNNGQIWKVDSKTGKVIWKLGKDGNMKMSPDSNFSQAHAAHINAEGSLMFFDNGVDVKQSSVFALKVDEKGKTVKLDFQIKLPKDVYNDRMGSAYMIDKDAILCCCSKRHITILTNRKGVLLWALESEIPPYRVEFIPEEKLKPFLLN
ncbi:arylsulfotransferase ASST [Flavobacterium sp. 90]|uniref:aryl-sulfate sulfotransferase n=1 Tax=unclassified Flavobacterium TaxID=196869 RepID=UPI000EB5086B|nr:MULTISPECIES: aryl-sulfate sulfotransferase [unclassified Flavobacterium]RKR08519.1 arylsulfotransferase ASST [Flavobacterium sp. 81]TCK52311.1 arylsulfotransferase ASST [Flavobacterium sp. 90]